MQSQYFFWQIIKLIHSKILIFSLIILSYFLFIGVIWERLCHPVFTLDLSGFGFQSAPILASSLMSGWAAYDLIWFSDDNHSVGNRTAAPESSYLLLLIGLIITLSSCLLLIESVKSAENSASDKGQSDAQASRVKILLNLILVHFLGSFFAGMFIPFLLNFISR